MKPGDLYINASSNECLFFLVLIFELTFTAVEDTKRHVDGRNSNPQHKRTKTREFVGTENFDLQIRPISENRYDDMN